MKIEWKNVDIEVKNNNRRYAQKRIKLISNACGFAENGLFAIMGPSGSGKTTFMKALSGRIDEGSKTTGSILLDGMERDYNKWRSETGYVDQDDEIFDSLTVRKSITYAAEFRLQTNRDKIFEKVESLCKKLSITHIIDCKMANISGGERKRVMLAIELITDPKIIFLDEPTSGLDNFTTLNIVKLLKGLANEGKIIVFTIHQPDDETTEQFDNIMLFSQGRTVYLGALADCEEYLKKKGFEKKEKDSFSNFAMRILSVEPGVYHESVESGKLDILVEDVKKKYEFDESEKNARTSNDEASNLVPNFRHILILTRRRFKLQFFTKKNITSICFSFLSLLLVFLLLNITSKALNKASKSVQNSSTDMELENLMRAFDAQDQKDKVKDIYINSLIYSAGCVLGSFFICFGPLTTGVAFQPENKIIRREMGVATYSVSSYFISVLIFEILKCSPLLLIIAEIFYFAKIQYKFTFILLEMLLFLTSIIIYLFSGSISTSMKKIIFVFGIALIFNSVPLYSIILILKIFKFVSGSEIFLYVFNFFPHFIIGPQIMINLNQEKIKAMKDFLKSINSSVLENMSFFAQEVTIDQYKSLCLGFPMSMWMSLGFLSLWMLLVKSYTLIRLSDILLPSIRMSLNNQNKK